jgi:FkbM family methyltransferase
MPLDRQPRPWLGKDVHLMVTSDWTPPSSARHRRMKTAIAWAYRTLGAGPSAGTGAARGEGSAEASEPTSDTVQAVSLHAELALRSELLIEVHSAVGQLRSELLGLAGIVRASEHAASDAVSMATNTQEQLGSLSHNVQALHARMESYPGLTSRVELLEEDRRLLDGWDRWRLDALSARVQRQHEWLRSAALVSRTGLILVEDRSNHSVLALRRGEVLFEQPAAALVHADCGVMLVPSDDAQIAGSIEEHGLWSRTEAATILSALSGGGAFLDIGAHTGYFGLLALTSRDDIEVVFVEADPDLATLIEHNMAVNGVRGHLVSAAAHDEPGRVFLSKVTPGNPGDQRVYNQEHRTGRWVRAVRLDDELPSLSRRVVVIKTDCQGRDHLVLRGLEALLRRDRPVLVSEFWPEGIEETDTDVLDVLSWLNSAGYDVTVLDPDAPPATTQAEIARVARELPGGAATLLCTPRTTGSEAATEAAASQPVDEGADSPPSA